MASKPKRKAIWFDPETAAVLDSLATQLAEKLGFRPTPSQVIRFILKDGLVPDGIIVPWDSLDTPKKPVSVG